jgi:hypothetical protein
MPRRWPSAPPSVHVAEGEHGLAGERRADQRQLLRQNDGEAEIEWVMMPSTIRHRQITAAAREAAEGLRKAGLRAIPSRVRNRGGANGAHQIGEVGRVERQERVVAARGVTFALAWLPSSTIDPMPRILP